MITRASFEPPYYFRPRDELRGYYGTYAEVEAYVGIIEHKDRVGHGIEVHGQQPSRVIAFVLLRFDHFCVPSDMLHERNVQLSLLFWRDVKYLHSCL